MQIFEELIERFETKGSYQAFAEDFSELINLGLASDLSDAERVGEALVVNSREELDAGELFWSFTAIGLASGQDYGTLTLVVDPQLKGLAHLDAVTALLRLSLNGKGSITKEQSQAYDLLVSFADRDEALIEASGT